MIPSWRSLLRVLESVSGRICSTRARILCSMSKGRAAHGGPHFVTVGREAGHEHGAFTDDEDFLEALALRREDGAGAAGDLAHLGVPRQSQGHTATQP